MKKNTVVFIITCSILSIVLQAVFVVYLCRISDFRWFMSLRSKIEKTVRLSCGTEDSFMNFTKNSNFAILKMPSCGTGNAIIPEKFDYACLLCMDKTAVFSLYPSDASVRKHTSFYMKNINRLEFIYAGSLFEFKCRIKDADYGRSFFITRGISLMPSGPEVF